MQAKLKYYELQQTLIRDIVFVENHWSYLEEAFDIDTPEEYWVAQIDAAIQALGHVTLALADDCANCGGTVRSCCIQQAEKALYQLNRAIDFINDVIHRMDNES